MLATLHAYAYELVEIPDFSIWRTITCLTLSHNVYYTPSPNNLLRHPPHQELIMPTKLADGSALQMAIYIHFFHK